MRRQVSLMRLGAAKTGLAPRSCAEIRLVVEEDGELRAIGAMPASAEAEAAALEACYLIDWSRPWADLMPCLDERLPSLCAPTRALFDMVSDDGAAREAGLPLWRWLSGNALGSRTPTSETVQPLFLDADTNVLQQADALVARGFDQLKLCLGDAEFDSAAQALQAVRSRFGPDLRLSIDAGGRWAEADACSRLRALSRIGLDYIEQPLPPADWAGIRRLASVSPVPVMLKESLSSMHAVERMAEEFVAPLAHLSLGRLGGLDRLMVAGRRLQVSRIQVMVGDMHDGNIGTLAAAHVAIALKAPLREVSGIDALPGDPAMPAPLYERGRLHPPQGAGLGITAHPLPDHAELLWQKLTV